MQLREELAMKTSLILFVFLSALIYASAADDKQPELKLSEVGIQLVLAPTSGKHGPEKIALIVTIRNVINDCACL